MVTHPKLGHLGSKEKDDESEMSLVSVNGLAFMFEAKGDFSCSAQIDHGHGVVTMCEGVRGRKVQVSADLSVSRLTLKTLDPGG